MPVTVDDPDSITDAFDDDLQDLESDADALLDSIKDPINRLYRVSTWIRNPSSRFYSAKAQFYKQIDPETGVDLLQAFEPFDVDYVDSLFAQYESPEQRKRRYESGNTPGDDSFKRRIATSNSRRKRQFAYWRAHREKLNKHTIAATQKVGQSGLNAPSITTASHLNISQLDIRDDQSNVSVSEYAVSIAPPRREPMDFSGPIGQEIVSSTGPMIHEAVEFPAPPKQKPGDKIF